MWCTSGPAPVAIDDRQTGVSDGKVGRRAAVVAVLGEEAKRRRAVALDRALEGRRRQPVDDDQDELLGGITSARMRSPA